MKKTKIKKTKIKKIKMKMIKVAKVAPMTPGASFFGERTSCK